MSNPVKFSRQLVVATEREVRRAELALSRDSPPDFWIRRLDEAAKGYERAAEILRAAIRSIEAKR